MDLEYLLIHKGGRGQHLVYELLFNGSDNDKSQMMGLIDTDNIKYDAQTLEVDQTKLDVSWPHDGAKFVSDNSLQTSYSNGLDTKPLDCSKAVLNTQMNSASHHSPVHPIPIVVTG